MRRLPVFFVLDVSESMVGENHTKLEDGLRLIVRELRQDPHALESVFLSVIAFAGKSRTLVPLVELTDFAAPELPIGRGTALSGALNHLMNEIDRQVRQASPTQKGDWKPLVFLMTDGYPTENIEEAVRKWTDQYANRASLVAISIGADADLNALKKLTSEVLVFEETEGSDLTAVIRWISQSIQAKSRALETNEKTADINVEQAGLRRISLAKDLTAPSVVDERFAIIVGQCQARKLPYILKYQRVDEPIRTQSPNLDQLFSRRSYELTAVQPLRRSFFEMSADDGNDNATINLEFLVGAAPCPHCTNAYGFSICRCGNIFCASGQGVQTCPWCDEQGIFGHVNDGEIDQEIRRSQG